MWSSWYFHLLLVHTFVCLRRWNDLCLCCNWIDFITILLGLLGSAWRPNVWPFVVGPRWSMWMGYITTWGRLHLWPRYSCSIQPHKWAHTNFSGSPACYGGLQLVSGWTTVWMIWVQLLSPIKLILFVWILIYRTRMWWPCSVPRTIATGVGTWLLYSKSVKTWSRISSNSTQLLARSSRTQLARLQTTSCELKGP